MGGREQQAEGEETGVDKPGQCDVQIGIGPGKSESEVILDGVEQEQVSSLKGNWVHQKPHVWKYNFPRGMYARVSFVPEAIP